MKKRLILTAISLALLLTAVACSSSTTTNIDTSSMTVEELKATIEKLQKENEKLKKENAKLTEKEDKIPNTELSYEEQLVKNINFDNADLTGMCGKNLYYLYKDGILLIKGTGILDDISGFADLIEANRNHPIYLVVVEEGCTFIDFRIQFSPNKIILPDSLIAISASTLDVVEDVDIEMSSNTLIAGGHGWDETDLELLTYIESTVSYYDEATDTYYMPEYHNVLYPDDKFIFDLQQDGDCDITHVKYTGEGELTWLDKETFEQYKDKFNFSEKYIKAQDYADILLSEADGVIEADLIKAIDGFEYFDAKYKNVRIIRR